MGIKCLFLSNIGKKKTVDSHSVKCYNEYNIMVLLYNGGICMKMRNIITALMIMIFAGIISVSAAELKPGLNLLTGTTEVFDFEGDISTVRFSGAQGVDKNGKTVNAVVTRASSANADNKAAAVKGNGDFVYFDIDYPVIEMKRPIQVKYDYVLGIDGSQVRYHINNFLANWETTTFHIEYKGKQSSEVWRSASVERSAEKLYNFNGQTSYYKGGEDIVNHAWCNYSGAAQVSYFDNLSVIPAYKITYDLNGGSGNAEADYTFSRTYSGLDNGSEAFRAGYKFSGWSLTNNGTTPLTSVNLTPGEDITLYAIWVEGVDTSSRYVELYDGDVLRKVYKVREGEAISDLPVDEVKDNKIMLGWQTADGNTIYGYRIPAVTENLRLYSVWEPMETKIGVNLFENGDFESDGGVGVKLSNGKGSIVTEDDGNRALLYEKGSGYASLRRYVAWEDGRKYKISFRVKADYSNTFIINCVYGGNDNIKNSTTIPANTWKEVSFDYLHSSNAQSSAKDAISLYYNPAPNNEARPVYYDDIEFIPYYKVTYHPMGGTGAPDTEYFLGDNYVVSTTVPVRRGYLFKGWATTNGGTVPVTQITPQGEDINLYAIWEGTSAQNVINYSLTSDVPGVANGSIWVIAPEEALNYTDVEVYHADADGIMAGYTPFATMKLVDGSAAYNVTGNRAFPAGATRLAFVFKANGLSDIIYWYNIPQEHRFDDGNHQLKYSFWAISDSHLGGSSYNSDYWPEMTVNRNNAMRDMFSSNADFMFINGDVANYGTQPYANVLRSYLTDVLNNSNHNINNIPVFLVNGNHEYMNTNNANGGFDFDPIDQVFKDQIEYIKANYPNVTITTDEDRVWYAADIDGAKFIFLSSPEETTAGNTHTMVMSDRQLRFLDQQLYEGEYSNKTVFVVTHVPLSNTYKTGSGYESGISNSNALIEILNRHPNLVLCTGHTHSELGYEGENYVGVGDMTTTFSHLNDGCVAWIAGYDGSYIKNYSTGMLVEVYNDLIIVKSRKFLQNSLYFGHAMYIIPTPDSNAVVEKAEISGPAPTDKAVLTANIQNPENYTFQWIVAGEVVCTERTWNISVKNSFGGEYVYLRAIDGNGNYATARSAQPFTSVTVSYDLNGGSGACPESEKIFGGTYKVNNSAFPKKTGKFFVGWFTDKTAKKPEAYVNVSGDTVLYAVYSDAPKFYFDANNSGFSPNSVATKAEVEEGVLVTTSPGGDQYYTWRNGSFAAGDYPYLRMKIKADEGTYIDGVFFESSAGGFSEARHLVMNMATVVATLDGYKIYEFDIPNIPEEGDSWTGTISALRYDATLNSGTTKTDYLVFTDKKGIYKADITLDSNNEAVLSQDSVNCSVGAVSNINGVVSIELIPDVGYEFTTAEDVMAFATINGKGCLSAEVKDNGSAVVKYVQPKSFVIGTASENAVHVDMSFEKCVENATVIVATYDINGRFVAASIKSVDTVKDFSVTIDGSLGVKGVKAFALNEISDISPVVQHTETSVQ